MFFAYIDTAFQAELFKVTPANFQPMSDMFIFSCAYFSAADVPSEQYSELTEPDVDMESAGYKDDDLLFELVHKQKDVEQLIKFYDEKHSNMTPSHQSIFIYKLNKQVKQQ